MDLGPAVPPIFLTGSVLQVAWWIQVGKYASVSGYSVLIYDSILQFKYEWQTIWKAKGHKKLKVVYLVDKYLFIVMGFLVVIGINTPPHMILSNKFCAATQLLAEAFGGPSLALASAMLILRVMNLWKRHRPITYVLLALLAASSVGCIATVVYSMTKTAGSTIFIAGPNGYPNIGGFCLPVYNAKVTYITLMAPMIVSVVVTVLTVVNAWNRPKRRDRSLLTGLVDDGFFHFLVIFAFQIFCLLMILVAPPALFYAGTLFSWPISVATLARLLIRLRMKECKSENPSDGSFDDENRTEVADKCDNDHDDQDIELHATSMKLDLTPSTRSDHVPMDETLRTRILQRSRDILARRSGDMRPGAGRSISTVLELSASEDHQTRDVILLRQPQPPRRPRSPLGEPS